jgi:cytoskeletal protein CcmA (bactofilin family)
MNLSNIVNPMSESPTGSSNRNHLSSDVEIKGTLKFQNDLVFDGKIEGEIQSNATLTVGKSAHVQGEVKSKSIIIHGSVQGNIDAAERIELKATAQLIGDLRAGRIIIEDGATFVGKSEVSPNKSGLPRTDTSRPAGGPPSGDQSKKGLL